MFFLLIHILLSFFAVCLVNVEHPQLFVLFCPFFIATEKQVDYVYGDSFTCILHAVYIYIFTYIH